MAARQVIIRFSSTAATTNAPASRLASLRQRVLTVCRGVYFFQKPRRHARARACQAALRAAAAAQRAQTLRSAPAPPCALTLRPRANSRRSRSRNTQSTLDWSLPTQVPASINGADALARHVAASYRLKDAAVRLNWKGRPLARDAAVRTCLASEEPPVLEARLAQPRPTPAPHGPHSRAATAATQSGKRRRPVDDEGLRPHSRRRRPTDDSLDSCSLSDGYPMSDYEDADEPLYAKPLLAAHKAPLVPSWARELSDDVLREQSTIDPLAVFVDPSEKPVDLRAILGRSPVAPRRKVRARQEALDATSPSQWPSARGGGAPVDICLVVLAGDTLRSPLDAGGVVRRGAEYATIMRDVDTFGNLRRHYAKHHGLRESELALWSRQPGKQDVRLSLDACARHYHLSGTATVVVTISDSSDARRSRLVPRRLSASLSD